MLNQKPRKDYKQIQAERITKSIKKNFKKGVAENEEEAILRFAEILKSEINYQCDLIKKFNKSSVTETGLIKAFEYTGRLIDEVTDLL